VGFPSGDRLRAARELIEESDGDDDPRIGEFVLLARAKRDQILDGD